MAHTVIDPPAPQQPSAHPHPHQGYQQPHPAQGYQQPHGPHGYPQQHPQASPPGYPAAGPQAPRPASPRRALLIALASGGVLLVAVVAVYFAVFHYTPVALQHVPPGTTMAVRIDLVDVATYAPVRRHLLPLVDEPVEGTTPVAGARSDRLADAVGFSPSRDLREVVVCFLGSEDSFVVLVGGNIPKGKLVPGILKVAAAEGSSSFVDGGGIVKAKYGGVFIGQAEDGTAVVATDEASLRAALAVTAEAAALGISSERSVAWAARAQLWADIEKSSYATMLDSLKGLRALDAVNGYVLLGNAPRVESQVRVAPGHSPEDAKATLYRVFTDLRRVSELRRKLTGSAQDLAGEEQALAQSGIETKGPDVLRVSTPWPYDGLDRGAQNLAQKIRRARAGLSKPPEPPSNIRLPGGITLPIPGLGL